MERIGETIYVEQDGERERERERNKDRERERERESLPIGKNVADIVIWKY